jgi:hypothetical protein
MRRGGPGGGLAPGLAQATGNAAVVAASAAGAAGKALMPLIDKMAAFVGDNPVLVERLRWAFGGFDGGGGQLGARGWEAGWAGGWGGWAAAGCGASALRPRGATRAPRACTTLKARWTQLPSTYCPPLCLRHVQAQLQDAETKSHAAVQENARLAARVQELEQQLGLAPADGDAAGAAAAQGGPEQPGEDGSAQGGDVNNLGAGLGAAAAASAAAAADGAAAADEGVAGNAQQEEAAGEEEEEEEELPAGVRQRKKGAR